MQTRRFVSAPTPLIIVSIKRKMGIYIPFSWRWLWCGALSVEGAVCWRALSGGRVISTGLGVLSRQAAAYQIASNSAHSFSATSLVLGSRLLQHPVAAAFPGNSLGWFYSRASLVAQLVKNSPAKGDLGSIPGLERSPGEGEGYPLQYSGLENSMDYIVHGVAKGCIWATFTFKHKCSSSVIL